jgi:hypothetical protein
MADWRSGVAGEAQDVAGEAQGTAGRALLVHSPEMPGSYLPCKSTLLATMGRACRGDVGETARTFVDTDEPLRYDLPSRGRSWCRTGPAICCSAPAASAHRLMRKRAHQLGDALEWLDRCSCRRGRVCRSCRAVRCFGCGEGGRSGARIQVPAVCRLAQVS